MLDAQDLAAGAPYRLPDHGRVRVTLIDDGVVYYEREATGRAHKTAVADFRERADPLPVTIDLPTTDGTFTAHL